MTTEISVMYGSEKVKNVCLLSQFTRLVDLAIKGPICGKDFILSICSVLYSSIHLVSKNVLKDLPWGNKFTAFLKCDKFIRISFFLVCVEFY